MDFMVVNSLMKLHLSLFLTYQSKIDDILYHKTLHETLTETDLRSNFSLTCGTRCGYVAAPANLSRLKSARSLFYKDNPANALKTEQLR